MPRRPETRQGISLMTAITPLPYERPELSSLPHSPEPSLIVGVDWANRPRPGEGGEADKPFQRPVVGQAGSNDQSCLRTLLPASKDLEAATLANNSGNRRNASPSLFCSADLRL